MKIIKIKLKQKRRMTIEGLEDSDILEFMKTTNATVAIEPNNEFSVIDRINGDLETMLDIITLNHDVEVTQEQIVNGELVLTFGCWE